MNDDDLRREYQRSARSAPFAEHPKPEQLERIVTGGGSEAERIELLEHVLRCPTCGPELDLLRAANEGARAVEPRMPNRQWLAIAAVALLVIGIGTLVLRGRHVTPGADVLRGHTQSIALVEPAGGSSVALPLRLAWQPVNGAASYRVELLGTNGELIGSWTTPDTTLAIADSMHVSTNAAYDVWVRATLADRTEVSSPIVRFNVK